MMIKPIMAEVILAVAAFIFSGLPAEVKSPKPPIMSMKKRTRPAIGKT